MGAPLAIWGAAGNFIIFRRKPYTVNKADEATIAAHAEHGIGRVIPMAGTVSKDSVVSLQEVTRDTVRAICKLKVSEYQNQFVAPNSVSIAEAYFSRDEAWFRAICADNTPVGFVMVYDDPKKSEYFIWRFMVDERYQKMGFGSKAMELVLDHIRSRPNAKEVRLSYHQAEGGPNGFYRKVGFVDTGEMWDDEHVMVLVF